MVSTKKQDHGIWMWHYLSSRNQERKLWYQLFKKFCPNKFDSFDYLPSIGASGGIITIWKSTLFSGTRAFQNDFSTSVTFTSQLSNDTWTLTNIYGPCQNDRKMDFLDWFSNITMPDSMDWLVLGDFNLIRSLTDRNKSGGDINETMLFNDAICNLGLIELPLKGRKFT